MQKKWIQILAAFAVMAVILSLTVFAADEAPAETTDYGVLTALFERLTLYFNAIFTVAEKVYALFAGIGG